MGYPSYARNCARALPSPSPFHYVMAKIVPVVQLAAHAKSSTSYGRTTKFFRLDGSLLFRIVMGLRWSSAIKILPLKTINQLQKKEKTVIEKNRTRSRKREGCNKDYVLVLEADN